MSEYLEKAAQHCQPNSTKKCLQEQQALLKQGFSDQVLNNLQLQRSRSCCLEDQCQALKCYEYPLRRLHQLGYMIDLANNIPIDSNEIESANRSIIQKRLKIPDT